jgi:hypothetical protein
MASDKESANFCQVIEGGPKCMFGTDSNNLMPVLVDVDFVAIPGGPTRIM